MASLLEKHVVTCFLEAGGEILLLRRSRRVGTYQGKWAGVSGYMETTDDEQALKEVEEETGLGQQEMRLLQKGEPLAVLDERLNTKWIVHPYLFHIDDRGKVKTDWEHTESKWIRPEELERYETVPGLKETLARVYPSRTGPAPSS